MIDYKLIRHPASADIYACEIADSDGLAVICRAYGPLDRLEQLEMRNDSVIKNVLDNHGYDVIEDAAWLRTELNRSS